MIGIGVDIGGTFVKIVVLNENGTTVHTEKFETHSVKTAQQFIARIGQSVNEIKAKFAGQQLAVAVGAPGDVDNKQGILRYNPNLHFEDLVNDWPIAKMLYENTGIRPEVVNDASLAAWGVYEKDLQRKPCNVLVVTMGTGIGGGLIINRELYQGSHGSAGEIGHTKIDDVTTGPQCGCGAHGCLEAFVGTIGIKRRVRAAMEAFPHSELAKCVGDGDFKIAAVAEAAKKGCPAALKIWEDTGRYLGIGIANFALILDMDAVVLTGGVSGAAPYFMPALMKVLSDQQIKTPFQHLQVLVSKTPDIGGVGAALFALHQARHATTPCA